MQVSVEAPNTLERRVTVIVPIEELEAAYDRFLSKFSKTAKIKGFRPGKIPLNYIKEYYGDTARKEALSDVIQKSLYSALNQEKLHPVGVPMVTPKTVLPGKPLEFTATFEILPEIAEVQFDLTTLEKQVATIQEEDIDFVLQHLRKQHTIWNSVDRPCQDKDKVVIDFKGFIKGKEIAGGKAEGYSIILGSNTMIPGFESGIVSMNKGDEKVVIANFPENYFSKDHAGKAAEFTIRLHEIFEPKLPEIDADFIRKMGVKSESLVDLRAEIKKNLERELKRVIKEKVKQQVFDHLLEKNPIEIPKALIEREAKRIHDELHPHHTDKEHEHSQAELASFNESGKRNVALGLIVAKLLRQYNIVADKERVKAHVQQLATVYENPEEVEKWYLTDKKSKADVEMYILEEQLVEKLLENVEVKEVMISYSALINRNLQTVEQGKI